MRMFDASFPSARSISEPHETQQSAEDSLVDLQLRIARRADELAAATHGRTPLNLLCWLQAEEEILHRLRSAGHGQTFRTHPLQSVYDGQLGFTMAGPDHNANPLDHASQDASAESSDVFARG